MEKNILSGQSFLGKLTDEEIEKRRDLAEYHFREFLYALGYDVHNDPNMKETPRRVTKMYMKEICRGTYEGEPKITSFVNQSKYTGIVFQGNIFVKSLCSHHLAPIKGKCHVAYIPGDKVVGLSKLNRIVDWFSRRPQLQEQLTTQIHDHLEKLFKNSLGIAVYIEADHACVAMRGIEHDSTMITSKLSGVFLDNTDKSRDEFYQMIQRLKE